MKKNKKIFIFDIDNTICKTEDSNYKNSKPKKKIINLINKLRKNGHIIKIFTSRYMGRNNDNSKFVKKKYHSVVNNQLKSWGLNYDELILGKPSYDFLIDDKSINPKKFDVIKVLKNYL